MKIVGIYMIISPTNRIYIGQSKDIEARFNSYKRLVKSNSSQRKLYNSLKKYSPKNHKFKILKECKFEELNHYERKLGLRYNALSSYNLTLNLPEDGEEKRLVSLETRQKLRDINLGKYTGEKSVWFGKRGKDHPATGNIMSDQVKQMLIRINTGTPRTEETKLKLHNVNKDRGGRLILDLETGIYYNTIKLLAKALNINYETFKTQLKKNTRNVASRYLIMEKYW